MKSIRLLPIVIFATAALLLFKGVGILTNGGYVLVGSTTAEAAGGGSHGGEASTGEEVASDGVASMIEPTMSDTAPTADDTAPTLPLGEKEASAHGASIATDHSSSGESATADAGHGEGGAVACPPVEGAAEAGDHGGEAGAEVACDPALVTAQGDAVPMVRDETGKLVPYVNGDSSEDAVLQRLSERRSELDAREQELDMRMALVEAAEKRIEERTALLEQLQARIDSLVDQNKSEEEEQFKAIVAMYETMKPKEAALIFDELDMNTLLRVARAMNPRKMAPIMARMSPVKAKDLTASMAIAPVEPTIAVTAEDLAALPQIVGQ